MKKIFLSITVILTFIFYSLHQRLEGSDEANVVIAPGTSNDSPGESSTPSGASQNSTQVGQQMGGGYKNGEYIGDVADAYYGNVEVKVIIAGGKITGVQFLKYPSDRRTSIEINSQAMPYLRQEAIQAQNANVDIVTGATQTSRAYRLSLRSALDLAKI